MKKRSILQLVLCSSLLVGLTAVETQSNADQVVNVGTPENDITTVVESESIGSLSSVTNPSSNTGVTIESSSLVTDSNEEVSTLQTSIVKDGKRDVSKVSATPVDSKTTEVVSQEKVRTAAKSSDYTSQDVTAAMTAVNQSIADLKKNMEAASQGNLTYYDDVDSQIDIYKKGERYQFGDMWNVDTNSNQDKNHIISDYAHLSNSDLEEITIFAAQTINTARQSAWKLKNTSNDNWKLIITDGAMALAKQVAQEYTKANYSINKKGDHYTNGLKTAYNQYGIDGYQENYGSTILNDYRAELTTNRKTTMLDMKAAVFNVIITMLYNDQPLDEGGANVGTSKSHAYSLVYGYDAYDAFAPNYFGMAFDELGQLHIINFPLTYVKENNTKFSKKEVPYTAVDEGSQENYLRTVTVPQKYTVYVEKMSTLDGMLNVINQQYGLANGKLESVTINNGKVNLKGWFAGDASKVLPYAYLGIYDKSTGALLYKTRYQQLTSMDIKAQYPNVSGADKARFNVTFSLDGINLANLMVVMFLTPDDNGEYLASKDGNQTATKLRASSYWVQKDGAWYYINENSDMTKGWKEISGIWYYMLNTGKVVTGWNKINNNWYYMRSWGGMVTGWNKINNNWYYMRPWGGMVTGWVKIGGTWYFMDNSGKMVTGRNYINGIWYYFKTNGMLS